MNLLIKVSFLLGAVFLTGNVLIADTDKMTVFAPTNDAFAKLPAGKVESLLKPENIKKLKNIAIACSCYSSHGCRCKVRRC